MKHYILTITTLLLFSNMGLTQAIDEYEVLIIQGNTTTHEDVMGHLDPLGHSITAVAHTSVVDGFDFSPYDVALFMWDTPMTFGGYNDLIAENEACNIGIVSMGHYQGMDSLFIGQGNSWTDDAFSIADNTHWITEPWSIGSLPLDFTYKVKLTNIPEGVTTLGLTGTDTSLVVHDTYRRASCVYYGHSSGMPWNADAEQLVNRIICWAASFNCCDVNTAVTATDFTLTADNEDATYQWIDCSDDSEIDGATNQEYTPTENGEYAVVLTEGDCLDTSDCFTITALNLDDYNEQIEVSIYPNPTKGTFNIISNSNELATVMIYDASGKLVSVNTMQSQLFIDNAMERGTYFVKYISSNSTQISKLIVE